MKNKMKRNCLVCIIFFIMFSTIIILIGYNTKKESNNENLLIGSWVSDWRTEQDLNIYFFSEDGTGKELIITKENVENMKGMLFRYTCQDTTPDCSCS